MFAHAQAPVRIGIAGGGTDLPAWTRERTGRCLSLAIAHYSHAVGITRPDGQVVASYSRLDHAPVATEIANGLIRESALMHGWESGFEVHTLSEISSQGSGLGASSSIAVALSALFSEMSIEKHGGPRADPAWSRNKFPQDAAECAWTVEIDRLRRPIGRQDHMAAAFGGLRLYRFEGEDSTVERTFSEEDAEWVAARLALVPLPTGHDSRAILSGVKSPNQLQAAYDAVDVAVKAIESRNVATLGLSLSRGQLSKHLIPGAVPNALAQLIERLNSVPGVHGCKVAGAGGGGHLVVCVEPGAASRLAAATEGLPVQRVRPSHTGVTAEVHT